MAYRDGAQAMIAFPHTFWAFDPSDWGPLPILIRFSLIGRQAA